MSKGGDLRCAFAYRWASGGGRIIADPSCYSSGRKPPELDLFLTSILVRPIEIRIVPFESRTCLAD